MSKFPMAQLVEHCIFFFFFDIAETMSSIRIRLEIPNYYYWGRRGGGGEVLDLLLLKNFDEDCDDHIFI